MNIFVRTTFRYLLIIHAKLTIKGNAHCIPKTFETFISKTQDTTVLLKSIQYLIQNKYMAAISPSYVPT